MASVRLPSMTTPSLPQFSPSKHMDSHALHGNEDAQSTAAGPPDTKQRFSVVSPPHKGRSLARMPAPHHPRHPARIAVQSVTPLSLSVVCREQLISEHSFLKVWNLRVQKRKTIRFLFDWVFLFHLFWIFDFDFPSQTDIEFEDWRQVAKDVCIHKKWLALAVWCQNARYNGMMTFCWQEVPSFFFCFCWPRHKWMPFL